LAKEEKQGKHKDKKEKEKEKEKRKLKRDEKEKTSNSENFSCVTKYRPLMHVAFLGPDELVAVERPWVRVAQALPEALHRHTYRSGA
jgi:U3 small nucleolar RNA-associated protein 4